MRLPILTYPNPILRQKSREITETEFKEELQKDAQNEELGIKTLNDLLNCLYKNMRLAGGVGLAAPQIGILVRAFVVGSAGTNANFGFLAAFNPVIVDPSGKVSDVEGCLSVPELYQRVNRPEKITLNYLDIDGKACRIEAQKDFARAICHEADHLNGTLFIDRLGAYQPLIKKHLDVLESEYEFLTKRKERRK